MRKSNIQPVCSNDEAREYFRAKGLSYNDITEGELLLLVMLLNKELKAAAKDNETSVDTIHLSKRTGLSFPASSMSTLITSHSESALALMWMGSLDLRAGLTRAM